MLAATIAIPPMISGGTWFWPAVEIVMVIWLIGVGARLARVPAAAAVLLQIAGASIALTALFTVGGIGGVIPNGAVLSEAGDLLVGAWNQIRTTVSPAPATQELAFLICLTVGVTALIVDILIAVCRAPALVALPLLCVFSVPASIDVTMLPWEAFAGPAMLYAILLVASGLNGRRLGRRRRARAGRLRGRAGRDRDGGRAGGGRFGDRRRHRRPAAPHLIRPQHRHRAVPVRIARGQPAARRPGRHAPGLRAWTNRGICALSGCRSGPARAGTSTISLTARCPTHRCPSTSRRSP